MNEQFLPYIPTVELILTTYNYMYNTVYILDITRCCTIQENALFLLHSYSMKRLKHYCKIITVQIVSNSYNFISCLTMADDQGRIIAFSLIPYFKADQTINWKTLL